MSGYMMHQRPTYLCPLRLGRDRYSELQKLHLGRHSRVGAVRRAAAGLRRLGRGAWPAWGCPRSRVCSAIAERLRGAKGFSFVVVFFPGSVELAECCTGRT